MAQINENTKDLKRQSQLTKRRGQNNLKKKENDDDETPFGRLIRNKEKNQNWKGQMKRRRKLTWRLQLVKCKVLRCQLKTQQWAWKLLRSLCQKCHSMTSPYRLYQLIMSFVVDSNLSLMPFLVAYPLVFLKDQS